MTKQPFLKPPLPIRKQVDILISRGMQVPDRDFAENYLLRNNYYRFCGYGLHFEVLAENGSRTDTFQSDVSFEDVVLLCEFDSELRRLLFGFIEPLEIAFRTALCFEMSTRTNDPHWFLKHDFFINSVGLIRIREKCQEEMQKSPEVFIKAYKQKYSKPSIAPCWMMIELLSFGDWSRVYGDLKHKNHQKAVAVHFNTSPEYLFSWIRSIVLLRNVCAHHARLWNRQFPFAPKLPAQMREKIKTSGKVAGILAALVELLKPLGLNKKLEHDCLTLLRRYRGIPREPMGLKPKPLDAEKT